MWMVSWLAELRSRSQASWQFAKLRLNHKNQNKIGGDQLFFAIDLRFFLSNFRSEIFNCFDSASFSFSIFASRASSWAGRFGLSKGPDRRPTKTRADTAKNNRTASLNIVIFSPAFALDP